MKKLYKTKPKMLFGVCSGLSDYTGIDVSLIRIAAVIGAICTGTVLLWVYLLFGIILPNKEDQ